MRSPSVSLREAARQSWDVIVVGAGPAGALAARETARAGRSVLLVDRATFPRWKVCGSCLNGRALATLAQVGLADLTAQHKAVPLNAFHLASTGRSANVPLPGGVALSRGTFDTALVESAVSAGAAFLPATRAVPDSVSADARTLRLVGTNDEATVSARVVLAADGLASTFAPGKPTVRHGSRVGAGTLADDAPAFYSPGTIFMACGPAGYVGLVRQEDHRLDIAAAFDARALPGHGPAALAEQTLAHVGWPAIPNLRQLPWRGTPALTRTAGRLAAHRLFVLGDAAGYVEPFTGEGMAWALAGARAVAPLAIEGATNWRPSLPAAWTARYRQAVRSRQTICRAAAHLLRSPTLTSGLIALLRLAPGLLGPLVRSMNGPNELR
jgi:flavin-dependent dehydrogenase